MRLRPEPDVATRGVRPRRDPRPPGPISGGHLNPAVTLAVLVRGKIGLVDAAAYWAAQALSGIFAWAKIWVWLLADLAGGAVAGAAFLFLNPEDRVLRPVSGKG
jgi:glycerol uptake facilitator-like aquaporin